MKKLISLAALALCMLLVFPGVMAEETYIPGERGAALITEAWNAGKILKGDLTLRLDMDAAALGLSEEETAAAGAILPLLDSVTLGLGLGKLDGGLRFEADAQLEHAQGGEPVSVSAAANVDLYGISVESDLIPGQRVTSKWETLLAMAGMYDSNIESLIALRDTDWEALYPQIMETVGSYAQQAMACAAPYAEIFVNWAAALPVTLDAAPAPQGYPDVPSSSITITEKDILNLLAAICEYLKTDDTVSVLCDRLIQEFYTSEGEPPRIEALCNDIIAAAAACDNTQDALVATWGMREGMPVYGLLQLVVSEEGAVSLGLMGEPNEAGHIAYALRFDVTENGAAPLCDFVCTGEAGEGVFTADAKLAVEGAQVMGFTYALGTTKPTGDLPGKKVEQNITMVIDDSTERVQVVGQFLTNAALTEDGGEVIDDTQTLDMYVEGTQITTNALTTFSIFPDENGFTGSYSAMQSMPAYGINAVGADAILSVHEYDPASTEALLETAFETASSDTIDALISILMQNGQYKLISAMQALPTELLTLLMQME